MTQSGDLYGDANRHDDAPQKYSGLRQRCRRILRRAIIASALIATLVSHPASLRAQPNDDFLLRLGGAIINSVLGAQQQKQQRQQRSDSPATQQPRISSERRAAMGLQQNLNAAGYDAGPVDGLPGPRTREAIRAFQRNRGYPVTGQLGAAQRLALLTDAQRATAGQDGLRAAEIREVQAYLDALGYDVGPVDGVWGPRSQRALDAFRKAANVSLQGTLTQADAGALHFVVHDTVPPRQARSALPRGARDAYGTAAAGAPNASRTARTTNTTQTPSTTAGITDTPDGTDTERDAARPDAPSSQDEASVEFLGMPLGAPNEDADALTRRDSPIPQAEAGLSQTPPEADGPGLSLGPATEGEREPVFEGLSLTGSGDQDSADDPQATTPSASINWPDPDPIEIGVLDMDILGLRTGQSMQEADRILRTNPDFRAAAESAKPVPGVPAALGYQRVYFMKNGQEVFRLASFAPDAPVLSVTRHLVVEATSLPFDRIMKKLNDKFGAPDIANDNQSRFGWGETITSPCLAIDLVPGAIELLTPVGSAGDWTASLLRRPAANRTLVPESDSDVVDLAACGQVAIYLPQPDLDGSNAGFSAALLDYSAIAALEEMLDADRTGSAASRAPPNGVGLDIDF